MVTGNISYKCWFCSTYVKFELKEELIINYEEHKTDGGTTFREVYTYPCPQCSTPLIASLKQFRNGSLLALDKKKGRKE